MQVLGPAECRVLVSSRLSAYDPGLLPWPAAERVECRIAPFSPAQRRAFVGRWFPHDPASGTRLQTLLGHNPRFEDLTRNALLLSLACAVGERHELSPNITRGELYEVILGDMAKGEWKPETSSPNATPLSPDFLLRLLARIAFARLRANPAGNWFRADDWIDDCIEAIEKLHLKHHGTDSILAQLNRIGLLVSPADGWLMFLHRSFLEYLAARHLAWRAETERWPKFLAFVDKKAWDPHYQEVMMFLAGRLADPRPVLALLADERRDDYFHHRLAVVAQGLPELQEAVRVTPPVAALIDAITKRAVSIWWSYRCKDTVDAVPHLTRALPALGRANG
ncbi:MAG: hypothetical protein RKP20_03315, partial [Candidatus Competibacter sp.]|nr:hypothetical protein [Candidatus Competibacter sp.]